MTVLRQASERARGLSGRAGLPAVVFLAIFAPASAHCDDAAQQALAASTGEWVGELYYLDYASGRRFAIPMRVDATVTPDGATLVRRLTFTDPGNLVHAMSLATVDPDGKRLFEAYFRERTSQHFSYDVMQARYYAETDWHLVYEHNGPDDDRPARIRHTMTRDGDRLTSTKEVRFLDDESAEFFLRNGTDLERASH